MADTQPVSPVAHGTAVFAGVLMIIGGAFQALEALAAIVNDKYLVVLPQYIYAFDLTLWGWTDLLVGLGLLAIGIALLQGHLGSHGRHSHRSDIGDHQLHLAALLALVGAHGDRH